MINKEYTFLTKATGPGNCMAPDGLFYGNDKFTWDFLTHWPVLTIGFAEDQTGKDLSVSAGSQDAAESELLKIAKISRIYIMNRIPIISQRFLEYRVAKDTDVLIQILLFQLEILQTWGGYQSLYRIKDAENNQSIGEAAIEFINGTDLFLRYYSWNIDSSDYRKDY